MIDWDSLAIGPCMATFGEAVVYTAPGGQPQVITGVFQRAYLELLPMGGGRGQEPQQFGAAGNITDRKPILGVQLSQFVTDPVPGGTVEFAGRGLTYHVIEVRPDGQGAAMLLLKLVAG